MRWADNWINMQSGQFASGIAEQLRLRAIKSFDARLANDPVFREIYEQYGDNYLRFANALVGRAEPGRTGLLTPAELTGKFDPRTMEKAAIQMRRTFSRNNDAVDLIMLKHWWNKRHPNGDRNAPFLTEGQRLSLMFGLAEDVNMGSLANRAQWWAGSRNRQWLGVLNQYWLWITDKLSDLVAKPRGQKTYMVRYLPAVIGFLMLSALASLVITPVGQKLNDALFNTVSQKPDFWDATDDKERLKIITSNSAGYWGAIGSMIAMLADRPGKLGNTNPFLFYNVLTDAIGYAAKAWQSGDYVGPAMDFAARYFPPLQPIINRLPNREGLVEVRNAANALRAATPGSMEAKRRQPSAGSDFRATPMTPLYNAIINQAMEGRWDSVNELMQKAIEQQRALGNPNPEQAILSAIRTRAPESAVYQRVLTPEERERVYARLNPAQREQISRVNDVFDELVSRYGRGGAGALATLRPLRIGQGLIGGGGGVSGLPRLSLGAPRGVRRGFRGVSLRRGMRARSLVRRSRRLRTRRLRSRLPRLSATLRL